MTKMLFSVAHTMMKTPAPSTSVAATFFRNRKLDFQSIGIGIKMRNISVEMLVMNDDQRIGFDTAAWHAFPGSGCICQ
jgi:hypothetical protein